MQYEIIAFYKFVTLTDYKSMKLPLLHIMKVNEINGTIILANEGINGTCSGSALAIANLMAYFESYSELHNLTYKKSYNNMNPFVKVKVKLRKEIVTLGVDNVDPSVTTGVYIDPQQWNELISDPEVLVIDVRNDYEVQLGTFKGAVNPCIDNFRNFPQYVAKNLDQDQHKKIAMFCTGGIRCEKSTAYLKNLGFDNVYQLNGGILNYLKVINEHDSLWQGDCFVFDNRVAVDSKLHSLKCGSIDLEWKNNCKKF